MGLNEKIANAIEEPLAGKGYGLVRVLVSGGSRTVVAIDIERLDDAPVTIDDCVEANRLVSAILDVEDFIKNAYTLEVSSPGENRPLTKIGDFERFCGKDVKIELCNPINGKRKVFGKLVRVEQNSDDSVVYLREECDTEAVELGISYKNIKKASVKRVF